MIGSPCRVVLADDTPEIRMLVRMALELEGGFEIVGEAEDGAEACQLSENHKPDAIVLDLAMPIMDGLEAIPAIKKDNPDTKILVLSGFNASQMKREAMDAGADAYLEKGEPAHRIVQLLLELCPPPTDLQSQRDPAVDLRIAEANTVTESSQELEKGADTLSSLAHELMTPVTVIQGFAETMADRAEAIDAATVKEWAQTIARNATNMASIIRSFRETELLETGQVDLDLETVNLRRIVEETMVDLGSLTRGRDVILGGVDSLEVQADQVKTRQVITNLISNAEKFSPPDTPIEIELSRGVFYGEVSVRDHGRGVAADQRGALFKKFSRLGALEPGSGLGLYICRQLARAHGGDVVYTDAEGGGARFSFRLPLPA
jgi:signal transduction histidine kinase